MSNLPDTLTIGNFYNELTNNGIRLSHQFRLQFHIPLNIDLGLMTIFARGATIPGIRQNSAPVQYFAFPLNVPTNFEMDQELTFKVLCDAKMNIRANLLLWLSHHSNFNIEHGGNGNGVKQTPGMGTIIDIDVLDNNFANVIDCFQLVGAFPYSVGGFDVTHEAATPIMFDLGIRYQYWKSAKGKPAANANVAIAGAGNSNFGNSVVGKLKNVANDFIGGFIGEAANRTASALKL